MASWITLLVLPLVLALLSEGALSRKQPHQKAKTKTTKPSAPTSLPPFMDSNDAKKLNKKELQSYFGMEWQKLFQKASDECGKKNFLKCYAMFSIFYERFPSASEGFTNAAVALEGLDRADDAIRIYEHAMKLFADNENEIAKVKLNYVNTLQHKVHKLYSNELFDEALLAYESIVNLVPPQHLEDSYINIGNILERMARYKDAEQSYKAAFDSSQQKSVKALNAICRLKLIAIGGTLNGRFDVTQEQKLIEFEEAKDICALAVQVDKNDATANMNMGMLFKEGLHFDEAIKWMKKGHELAPNDLIIMTNLASTYSRNDMIEEAVAMNKRILKINPTPSGYNSLGVFLAPFERKSKEGAEAHLIAANMHLAQTALPFENSEKGGCTQWTYRYNWHDAKNVSLTVVSTPSQNYFGMKSAHILEGKVDDTPLEFIDKQIIAIQFNNVYIGGPAAIPYTYCEVYPTTGINTDLGKGFVGNEKQTVMIDDEVINLIGAKSENYYHWLAEGMSRVLISYQYYVIDGHAPNARIILPARSVVPHVWEAIETLGLKFGNGQEPLEYYPVEGRRLQFRKLHLIDWVQLNKEDEEQNDLWSMYLPPCEGLKRTRDLYRNRTVASKTKYAPIVYVSRTGVREVLQQNILIDALTDLVGDDNLFVFGMPGRMSGIQSFDDQVNVFKNAKIILGPHGAGLTNMVFLPSDATVMEFAMKPHCNRCFGYIAMCLDLDYWLIPQVSTNYHLKYEMTESKAHEVVKVLRHVIRKKGLQHLFQSHEEL